MNEEMLEILIGKYIDSEITPAEERLLQMELERNEQARRMLEELRKLQDQARQALTAHVVEGGQSAEVVFERAWAERSGGRRNARPIKLGGWLRFAAGLAAGFALALGGYFVLPRSLPSQPQVTTHDMFATAENTTTGSVAEPRIVRAPRTVVDPRIRRTIDWYNFTDDTGDQWLVETHRENKFVPVVYHGDL
jgi:anti-sigma factor RsiW